MQRRTRSGGTRRGGKVRLTASVQQRRRSGGLPVFVWAALAMAATRPGPWKRRGEDKAHQRPAMRITQPPVARRTGSPAADLRADFSPPARSGGETLCSVEHAESLPATTAAPMAHAPAPGGMSGFAGSVRRVLNEGVLAAKACGDVETEYRSALCAWEDRLFAQFRQGHEIITKPEADLLIAEIFAACGRPAPALELVPGFPDPKIGGYADVAENRILIEEGFLYRYLLLHEISHILVPEDLFHGPAFIYVLQMLYRICLGIPEDAIRTSLEAHGLPSYTHVPN
jgi:hypothetical protein